MQWLNKEALMPDSEIIAACTALSIAYARHVDFGEYDKFVELFTEDGRLDVGFPLEGRDAIQRGMTRRPAELRSRHIITNVSIDVQSEQEAIGISYLTLYRHVGPESLDAGPIIHSDPAAVGHYEDRYSRTAAGWRIADRKLHFAFRNPAYFE
jgi:hypothetical protein